MTSFMDGYTRWIIEDEDDDVEDADGAGNDDTGQDEEMIDNGGGEEAGHGGGEGAGHGGVEGVGMAAERTWTPRRRVHRY